MNRTTIANLPSSNWKRIKGQYVAAAAGVALALSVTATGISISSTSKPAPAVREASVPVAATRNVSPPHHYFYIAGSEAVRASLLQTVNSYEMAAYLDGQPDSAKVQVLVAGPASELLQTEGARELMALGVPFTIVDMTAPRGSVVQKERTQVANADVLASALSGEMSIHAVPAPVRQGSAADIAASVLSTELANFPVPAQRTVSEQDIMAGVISSELAHFGN